MVPALKGRPVQSLPNFFGRTDPQPSTVFKPAVSWKSCSLHFGAPKGPSCRPTNTEHQRPDEPCLSPRFTVGLSHGLCTAHRLTFPIGSGNFHLDLIIPPKESKTSEKSVGCLGRGLGMTTGKSSVIPTTEVFCSSWGRGGRQSDSTGDGDNSCR